MRTSTTICIDEHLKRGTHTFTLSWELPKVLPSSFFDRDGPKIFGWALPSSGSSSGVQQVIGRLTGSTIGRSNITYTATAFVEVPEEPKENGKPMYQSKKEKEREEKEKEKKKLSATTTFSVIEKVDLEVVKSEPRSKEVTLTSSNLSLAGRKIVLAEQNATETKGYSPKRRSILPGKKDSNSVTSFKWI
jgi:hypothetical protein